MTTICQYTNWPTIMSRCSKLVDRISITLKSRCALFQWIILTYVLSRTISKLLQVIGQIFTIQYNTI